ncbi:MAG: hypothetical protein AAF514_13070 [Verrucomicrobiota bacterium]
MREKIQDQIRGRLLPLQARRMIDGFWVAENGEARFHRMPIPENQLKSVVEIIGKTLSDYGRVGRQVEKLGVGFDKGNVFVSSWEDCHVGILYSNERAFEDIDRALHDCLRYLGVPRLSDSPLISQLPVAEVSPANWEEFKSRLTSILGSVMDSSRATRTVTRFQRKRYGTRTPASDEWKSFGEAVLESLPRKRHRQKIPLLQEELRLALRELHS